MVFLLASLCSTRTRRTHRLQQEHESVFIIELLAILRNSRIDFDQVAAASFWEQHLNLAKKCRNHINKLLNKPADQQRQPPALMLLARTTPPATTTTTTTLQTPTNHGDLMMTWPCNSTDPTRVQY